MNKISIVTVCYNEENTIERTVRSVYAQTAGQFEYIICDGKSTDRTLEKLEPYKERFAKKGVDFLIQSKKDEGIYHAMNEGISLAQGEYILFLNAGDKLCSESVVEVMLHAMKDRKCDVYYGDCILVDRSFEKIKRCDDTQLHRDMSICHQSVVVKTDLMKERMFDTSLKLAADYDFLLYLKNRAASFYYVDTCVAYYYMDGLSSNKIMEVTNERFQIWDRYGIGYSKWKHYTMGLINQVLSWIKREIPFCVWEWWAKYKKRKKHVAL